MGQEDFLQLHLDKRKAQNAFRQLKLPEGQIDFCSNDYLGLSRNERLKAIIGAYIHAHRLPHGSTGSRLLAGNYELIETAEKKIALFHEAAAGLIFNSGYDANTGLFSSVPQKGDTIIYDHLIHASIRDGIRLSRAQAFSFLHNDGNDLEKKLQHATGNVFVAVETVYSMDGDLSPLGDIAALCGKYHAHLIVDEAHATGIIGERGEGLVQQLRLSDKCFARIHTFGKALGAHGAIILGSQTLKDYLINFCRAFIYTTALPPATIAAVLSGYEIFPGMLEERKYLGQLIDRFQKGGNVYKILPGRTPIQVVLIPGNEAAKQLAGRLQSGNMDVRAILHPTVPKGQERLRVVLHSFNTTEELERLIAALQG